MSNAIKVININHELGFHSNVLMSFKINRCYKCINDGIINDTLVKCSILEELFSGNSFPTEIYSLGGMRYGRRNTLECANFESVTVGGF